MFEQLGAGVGTTRPAQKRIRKERVRSASKAKVRAKAKAEEIVTIAVRWAAFLGNAPIRQTGRARARDSKENVALAAKQVIPHESARRATK